MADDDALAARRAEALALPLRWRILRACLHEARTNAELAQILGVNPGSMLRHVRLLVETGFLAPQEERRGKQGSREIPYLATRLTWRGNPGDVGPVLVHTLLDEIAPLEPHELGSWRLGVRLPRGREAELVARMRDLFHEASGWDTDDPDAVAWSLTAFLHPDRVEGGPADPLPPHDDAE